MLNDKSNNLQEVNEYDDNLTFKNFHAEELKEQKPNLEKKEEDFHDEINASNAEDAEDDGHKERHEIPFLDYHAMSLDKLIEAFEKLLKNEKVQAIKKHIDQIKNEFDLKFQEIYDQKKEDFVSEGNDVLYFSYTPSTKIQFNNLYKEYKEKRHQYYKNLELQLHNNLKIKLAIIEELKGLINVEENINETYKHFKDIQDRWHTTGPIPRVNYNDVWKTYQHHIERFYDFLDLNRDLRDLDFKRNLEEKEKIIEQAEELAEIEDINKAFRELQMLHKIWKEDLGPVDRAHREIIWNRFSAATKVIHQKRVAYFKNLDAIYEQNLSIKKDIISKIQQISNLQLNSHNAWQKQIKEIETLRNSFFNAGKVPYNKSEEIWSEFKDSVRAFNRNKNNFYKNLKKEQQTNIEKKLELVRIAESLKDSEDWEDSLLVMKKIQTDWKTIGHVPKKHSDKIWNEFKTACNHYFDRFHERKNKHFKEEMAALEQKKVFLGELREYQLTGDKEKDLKKIKIFISNWKSLGRVPYGKRNIEGKFNKIIDALFKKLDLDKQKAELIKYGNKIETLINTENQSLIDDELIFIKRKIDQVKSEIKQLENNLLFINANKNNPIVKEVEKNIERQRETLELWKEKFKKIKEIKK